MSIGMFFSTSMSRCCLIPVMPITSNNIHNLALTVFFQGRRCSHSGGQDSHYRHAQRAEKESWSTGHEETSKDVLRSKATGVQDLVSLKFTGNYTRTH